MGLGVDAEGSLQLSGGFFWPVELVVRALARYKAIGTRGRRKSTEDGQGQSGKSWQAVLVRGPCHLCSDPLKSARERRGGSACAFIGWPSPHSPDRPLPRAPGPGAAARGPARWRPSNLECVWLTQLQTWLIQLPPPPPGQQARSERLTRGAESQEQTTGRELGARSSTTDGVADSAAGGVLQRDLSVRQRGWGVLAAAAAPPPPLSSSPCCRRPSSSSPCTASGLRSVAGTVRRSRRISRTARSVKSDFTEQPVLENPIS